MEDKLNNKIDYRELGNKYFKEKRLNLALENYNIAIELDSNDYQSYTNRSLVFFQRNDYEKSLQDANESIKINSKWYKAYYRKSLALNKLNKFDESLRTLYTLYNKKDELSQSNIDINLIKKEIDTIQKQLIQKRYSNSILSQSEPTPNSITSNIKVDYVNADLGKSVFLLKDITINQAYQPIVTELPLVSNVDPIFYNNINFKFCNHCLKLIHLDKSKYNKNLQSNFPFLFNENNNCKSIVKCSNVCKFEIYCSEKCKENAWNQYHSVVCSKYDKLLKLYEFCRLKNQIFPIIIMKIFTIILSDIKSNNKSLDDAMLPFTAFTFDLSNVSLNDDQIHCLSIISDIFKSILNNNENEINIFNQLINNEKYHQFDSILKLNSSDCKPISIFEEYIDNLVSKTPLDQDYIVNESGLKILISDIGELISNNKTESISGVGLYRVINSCNHSCDPNVLSTFNKNNNTMTLFPIVDKLPLKKMTELNFSYIDLDSNPSYEQRQKLLKENYLFNCNCKKCKSNK